MKIMTFHLSDGAYAVELSAVVEVVRSSRIAGAGEALLGSRGVPLFDLADRLGAQSVRSDDAPALVLRGRGGDAGVLVERLGEVVEVEDLRDLPRYFASPMLRAVAQVDDALIVLLESDALLEAAATAAISGGGPTREES